MKKLCINFILFLWALNSFPQLTWVNYENSGQYNDAFSSIAFDNHNRPWAGTLLNGVHHFNGTSFQNYNTLNSPILHDKIYDLIYDEQESQLWVATLDGLSVLKENVWTSYTTDNSNLPSNVVLSLAKEKDGRIWIGTDKGVIDGLNGIVYSTKNTNLKGELIFHICIDAKGNKWFATDEEVARFDGKTWQIFSDENSVLPDVTALCVAEDPVGTIWASFGNTYSGTLAAYDGVLWKVVDGTVIHNLSSRIRSIVPLNNGSVWFGTHDKGLIRYKDSEWSAFTTDNSEIPINQIISMKADREDNLWMAHRNGLTKVQTDSAVGVNSLLKRKFRIIPNPVVESARIILPESSKKTFHLLIFDLKGQMVRQVTNVSDGYLFERRDLIQGVYLLKFYNSEETFFGKLIAK